VLAPAAKVVPFTVLFALGALLLMGGLAAWGGGASIRRGAARMVFWGALAMALTAMVGHLFGAVV
jgi:VIT1/CCC1 family predicted Fe2+/Mn2+ transporter